MSESEAKGDGIFAVIGDEKHTSLKPLKAPIPQWFRNAIAFEKDVKKCKSDEYDIECLRPFLDQFLIEKLKEKGIRKFFPVQKAVIPYLVSQFQSCHLRRMRDVCVSSPTGSGKTLAFVLPVIQWLSKRIITKIRCLIVFPVRDLALQVFQVFDEFCKGTSLKVGLAVGQQSFQEDVEHLIKRSANGSFHSAVDILIATPGRLIDLIERAKGFSLKQLKILILDEADRMMNNELESNFLLQVEKAIYGCGRSSSFACFCGMNADEIYLKRNSLDFSCACSMSNYCSSFQPPVKLLFSATISNDPEKLQMLDLFQPIMFVASGINETSMDSTSFITPEKLKEKMIISQQEMKPLIVWYLLDVLNYRKVICFTKSVESTNRLHSVLKQLSNKKVVEFSSNLKAKVRNEQLKKFREGQIDVIVTSDILARGIDIECTKYVVCYDPPSNEVAYIHRIGRTARAGKRGTALTIVTPEEVGSFRALIRKAHREPFENIVSQMKIKKSELKPFLGKYREALRGLRKSVEKRKVAFKSKKKRVVNTIE